MHRGANSSRSRRLPGLYAAASAKARGFTRLTLAWRQSSRGSGKSRLARAPGEFLMSMRMLIDARHPEETRVAVVKGSRIEEFDFESAEHKQLKGNIYLAKVTRVEPSLQAAFIDYGGNRPRLLAFSEIHPDYYQVPQADRRVLDEAERQATAAEGNGAAEEADDGASEAVATDPEE